MTPHEDTSTLSDDLSVTDAAARIEYFLAEPDPQDASHPGTPVEPSMPGHPSTSPTQDARARVLSEFADILAPSARGPAELLSSLARLAIEQPARFERLQEAMQAAGVSGDESSVPAAQTAIDQARQLAALIPEWADPARASQELSEVRSFLLSQGVPQDYVATASDLRELAIARKAMLYDRAMAERSGLSARRVHDASRVLQPGVAAANGPGDATMDRLRLRLKQTGRLDDAAAIIERMLG